MLPNYWVNEVFPNPLQTPDQNYWIGVLMTDGYIQCAKESNCYSVGLELAVKDAYLVSRFAKFIGAKAHSSRNRVRALKACTKEIHLFGKHGIIPNKTGNEVWPNSITNDGAFLRGLLDGDGSVGVYNNRSLSLAFYSASEPLLSVINANLNYHLGVNSEINIHTGVACLRVSYTLGWEKAGQLHRLLYSGSPNEPRLHRKERIIRIFASRPKPIVGGSRKSSASACTPVA